MYDIFFILDDFINTYFNAAGSYRVPQSRRVDLTKRDVTLLQYRRDIQNFHIMRSPVFSHNTIARLSALPIFTVTYRHIYSLYFKIGNLQLWYKTSDFNDHNIVISLRNRNIIINVAIAELFTRSINYVPTIFTMLNRNYSRNIPTPRYSRETNRERTRNRRSISTLDSVGHCGPIPIFRVHYTIQTWLYELFER